MSDKYWKELLLKQRRELETLHSGSADARGAVELDQSRVGRLSRMDALQGQAMNNAIAARRQQKLTAINAALVRITEGEFGYCVRCGDKIAEKQIKQDPSAPLCLDCSH